jgi:corrinoid protein of di/trimethylamine methyltransferase
MQEDLDVLKRALIVADMDLGPAAVQRLVDAGADPKWILEEGMAVAMFDLGEMWKRGEVFLPEVVASAEVFKRCNAIVEPVLLAQKDPDEEANALVLLATVKGDLHDLGKNMVGAMLRTSGFDVHDLGKDVSADRIIEAIEELKPTIVGLSALLTTTVPYQETVIRKLESAGVRDRVWVMVGGAPVTPEWADKIGADGYANNAPEAVEIAKKLVAAVR